MAASEVIVVSVVTVIGKSDDEAYDGILVEG